MRARRFILPSLLFWGALAFFSTSCAIADENDALDGNQSLAARARLNFEQIKLPAAEAVGLLGTSYLVRLPGTDGLFVGPSVYGAITGRRGGFFTFGAEASWRRRLVGPIGVEAGLYAGAGGGSGAPQGGGLMLRPHVDLWWDLHDYTLAVSVSKVRFPNGQINSTQFGVVLDKTTGFVFTPADRSGPNSSSTSRTGVGFDRIELVASTYRPRHGTMLSDGSLAPRTIALLGVRAEQTVGRGAYWGLEASGAAQSGVAGYAEYLGDVGYEMEMVPASLRLGTRVAFGMGGGGGIQTGGGLLGKAAVYGAVGLTSDINISIEAGLVDAPRGSFRAVNVAAALVWQLDRPPETVRLVAPVRTDVSLGLEKFRAPRRDGTVRELEADILEVDRFLGRSMYLTGQVHSALSGNAGGYSAALIGAGWLQSFSPTLEIGAQLLIGASGGGGVVSHGSVVEPEAYVGLQVSPAIGFRIAGGRVKALRGPLSSNVVNVLLSASYGV